jgi:molecular chaperone DnaK (HSP70)
MNCENLLRLFILSTCLSITISGYAIGIDLGDHKSVISSVCKKGVRVLTNKIGGRSTPSVGVFLDRERLLGECTAGGMVTRNLQHAMTNPRKMISNFNPTEDAKVLKVSMDEKTIVDLDPSSQIASFVWHLIQASQSNLKELDGEDSSDHFGCVVSSVPAHFLSSQKRLLENALTIACTAEHEMMKIRDASTVSSSTVKNKADQVSSQFSFPHIGLLTDGAASALTYGFDRRLEIGEEMKSAQEAIKKTLKSAGKGTTSEDNASAGAAAKSLSNAHLALGRIVCFVDLGYSCLQVTVAKITDQGAEVISHTGDNEVCGHALDKLLFDLAVEKLEASGKWDSIVELLTNRGEGGLSKAGIRLLEACMKAKVTLSANPSASVTV